MLSTYTVNVGHALDLTQSSIFTRAVRRVECEDIHLVIDLKDTEEVRDSGLAMLLMLEQHNANTDEVIDIVNCSPTIKFMLQSHGILKGFRILEGRTQGRPQGMV